jgi:hypothetical protein
MWVRITDRERYRVAGYLTKRPDTFVYIPPRDDGAVYVSFDTAAKLAYWVAWMERNGIEHRVLHGSGPA